MACGIGHTHVKVLKVRFSSMRTGLPGEINLKAGCCLITDGAGYFIVGHGEGRVCHDSAEYLAVYIPVKVSNQLLI